MSSNSGPEVVKRSIGKLVRALLKHGWVEPEGLGVGHEIAGAQCLLMAEEPIVYRPALSGTSIDQMVNLSRRQ